MKSKILIFSTDQYNSLKEDIAKNIKAEIGQIEKKTFSDGESYHRIKSQIKNNHVVLVGGTASDSELMEIYELSCALVKYGAQSLSLIIPYFGYSTMERSLLEGEVVKAKTRARLLSSIPKAYNGNNIYLLDLHTEAISHYFEGDVHCFHYSAKPIIIDYIKKNSSADFVIASTDAGRAKDVQKMAQDLNCDVALILKKRNGEETKAVAVSAEVKDKVVYIYDDMIRSGGSMIEAITTYKNAGAKEIIVLTVHGIFCSDAINKLKLNGISKIICTNSIAQENKDLTVLDISSILSNLKI
jgi:ribose-phosphate pyrophosphokinase